MNLLDILIYPVISFSDFKTYAISIYNILNNFYTNPYYNQRKANNKFNKYSIYVNQYTLEGTQCLRDYSLTMIYNKDTNTIFQNEHYIYVSDYFIKNLINYSIFIQMKLSFF